MTDRTSSFELPIENEVMHIHEKRSEMLESPSLVIELISRANEDINRDMKGLKLR